MWPCLAAGVRYQILRVALEEEGFWMAGCRVDLNGWCERVDRGDGDMWGGVGAREPPVLCRFVAGRAISCKRGDIQVNCNCV